jgi:hypothetical protein
LSPILGLDEHQSPYQSGRGSSERAEIAADSESAGDGLVGSRSR